MTDKLEPEAIKAAIEHAFFPYRTEVEFLRYGRGKYLRFRIRAANDISPIYEQNLFVVRNYETGPDLATFLSNVQDVIDARGSRGA